MDKSNEPDESRLDEILQQLEESPEQVSKAFGKPKGTPTPRERISQPQSRAARVYDRKPDGPKVEPSRIKPMPNVYRTEGGEPVEWVGFFKDEEAANMWINGRHENFVIEIGQPKRDLPLWGTEERKRKHGRKA